MNVRAPIVAVLVLSACSTPQPYTDTDTPHATGPTAITVSGISAGGYMAMQLHVAFSDVISGAAVIGAGPYECARGSLARALGACLGGDGLDVDELVELTHARARAGRIAQPNHLKDHRVWVFHGAADTVVQRPVADALVAYQRAFTDAGQIRYVTDIPAAHGFPTLEAGGSCDELAPDFINACGYDAAGALLAHLYDPLDPPQSGRQGELDVFPQHAFAGPSATLDESGYVFVPARCRDGARCRVHVALHGCRQGAEFIGDRFAAHAGYNAWAAANDILVLYPQLLHSPANPNGCWDWWGYTGPDYATRVGDQPAAIIAMARSLAETGAAP